MTENQKDKVLEILKSRGIETNEDVIYGIGEDDEKFVVCIDTNQMIIKKEGEIGRGCRRLLQQRAGRTGGLIMNNKQIDEIREYILSDKYIQLAIESFAKSYFFGVMEYAA